MASQVKYSKSSMSAVWYIYPKLCVEQHLRLELLLNIIKQYNKYT